MNNRNRNNEDESFELPALKNTKKVSDTFEAQVEDDSLINNTNFQENDTLEKEINKEEINTDNNNQVQSNETITNFDVGAMKSINEVEEAFPTPIQEPKIKHQKKLLTLCLILVTLSIIGYFVVYPIIQRKYMSNPKNVFKETIENASKNINNIIDDFPLTKSLYNIDFSFDTNVKELKNFSKTKFGIKTGIDVDNNSLETTILMKDKKDLSASIYVIDNKDYLKLSSSDKVFNIGGSSSNVEKAANEIKNLIKPSANNNDLKYLVDKVSLSFINSIDDKKLSKENITLSINAMKFEATKNTYEMNNKLIKKTLKKVTNDLINDKKSLEILSKLSGESMEHIKSSFNNNEFDLKLDKDVNLKISIYTAGSKKDVIGYEVISNNKVIFSYINNLDGDFESIIDMSDDDLKSVLTIDGIKENKSTKVTIKYNKEKITTLDIKNFEENKIDLSYVIDFSGQQIDGSLKITNKKSKDNSNANIIFNLNSGKDKLSTEINVGIDKSYKVAEIDNNNVVNYNSKDFEKATNKFIDDFSKTNIGEMVVGTISGLSDLGSFDSYINDYDYDKLYS